MINRYYLDAAFTLLKAASKMLEECSDALRRAVGEETDVGKGKGQTESGKSTGSGIDEPTVIFPDSVEAELKGNWKLFRPESHFKCPNPSCFEWYTLPVDYPPDYVGICKCGVWMKPGAGHWFWRREPKTSVNMGDFTAQLDVNDPKKAIEVYMDGNTIREIAITTPSGRWYGALEVDKAGMPSFLALDENSGQTGSILLESEKVRELQDGENNGIESDR